MFRQPIIYIPVLMISVLLGVELALLAAAHLLSTGQPLDPFAPYEAIMPGQPSAELSRFRCVIEKDSQGTNICRIHFDGGIFSDVILFSSTEDRITEVTFMANGLRIGDLVDYWGYPEINHYKNFYILSWQKQGARTIIASNSRKWSFLSAMSPVESIILTDISV